MKNLKTIATSVFYFLLISNIAFSQEIKNLDSFLVTAFDDRFQVISPLNFKSNMEIVLENKTSVKLIGKLVVNNSKNETFVAIMPSKFQKAMVKLNKGDRLHFIPMSPAFQEIELIVGNKTYEIPPKK